MSNKRSPGRVTLDRALSKLGVASRIEAQALIRAGKVKVHGSVETSASRLVNPNTAHIEISGKKAVRDESRIFAFHKPKDVLTTKRDPEGRKTIYDYLSAELQSFHAVGRLDQHTTGLLLLTNDTKLSSFLTDPKNKIPRTYLVTVRGEFTDEKSKMAVKGVTDRGELLRAQSVRVIKSSGKESLLEMTLIEGKNREIRRLCDRIGNEVTALKRISFGEYRLGGLKIGEALEIDTPHKD